MSAAIKRWKVEFTHPHPMITRYTETTVTEWRCTHGEAMAMSDALMGWGSWRGRPIVSVEIEEVTS